MRWSLTHILRPTGRVVAGYCWSSPWVFAVIGWFTGAAAIRVQGDSIFNNATVAGVLGGVWLAFAGALVVIAVPADTSLGAALFTLCAKALTVFLLVLGAFASLFLATFPPADYRGASGKYFLPGPFVALVGFAFGWLLAEAITLARRDFRGWPPIAPRTACGVEQAGVESRDDGVETVSYAKSRFSFDTQPIKYERLAAFNRFAQNGVQAVHPKYPFRTQTSKTAGAGPGAET